jgi:hypothetical protein
MTDKTEKHRKVAIIATLEEILAELDKQQLFLPALKIVEALEILGSSVEPDLSTDD